MNVRGTMTCVIPVHEVSQVGQARRAAQQLAESAGLGNTDAGRVALSATELASNLVKHARGGALHLRRAPGTGAGVELIAVDRGPGFEVSSCLADGFSTGGTQGIGLGAVARQATVFDTYSDARGSIVLTRIYDRNHAGDIAMGVSHHALGGDPACGDTWQMVYEPERLSLLVVDGLGHGEDAERAALAGADAFSQKPFSDVTSLLGDIHTAMNGTRGGAAAIAQYHRGTASLEFIGLGNISVRLINGDLSRGLVSFPGIAGVQYRKAQSFKYPDVAGQLLIMHTDGLQSRWNTADYPGLSRRHPAVIAALLHRDFCRGRDDVAVVVVVLESAHA